MNHSQAIIIRVASSANVATQQDQARIAALEEQILRAWPNLSHAVLAADAVQAQTQLALLQNRIDKIHAAINRGHRAGIDCPKVGQCWICEALCLCSEGE
jgi:hypothetical protein